MDRRLFVSLSSSAALSLIIPSVVGCAGPHFSSTMAQPKFLSHIVDQKMIIEIGSAYVKAFPTQGSESKIRDLLYADIPTLSTEKDPSIANSMLDIRTKQDFESEKTVVVDGWVLSLTEARQCALVSLISKG